MYERKLGRTVLISIYKSSLSITATFNTQWIYNIITSCLSNLIRRIKGYYYPLQDSKFNTFRTSYNFHSMFHLIYQITTAYYFKSLWLIRSLGILFIILVHNYAWITSSLNSFSIKTIFNFYLHISKPFAPRTFRSWLQITLNNSEYTLQYSYTNFFSSKLLIKTIFNQNISHF
jgi:hypothetical protein